MISPKTSNCVTFNPSIDSLARFELAYMAGKRINKAVFGVIDEISRLPVQIELLRDAIPRHLFPYLERNSNSYDSYNDLRHCMNKIMRDLTETPCRLHLTPLVDGVYVGEPRHLYSQRVLGDANLYRNIVGLGHKLANVTFLEDITPFIKF